MQLCHDVATPISSACETPAPIYQISQDKSKCIYLGQNSVWSSEFVKTNISKVSAWDNTPYNDGVILK